MVWPGKHYICEGDDRWNSSNEFAKAGLRYLESLRLRSARLIMSVLKVNNIGNSVGVILPDEILDIELAKGSITERALGEWIRSRMVEEN